MVAADRRIGVLRAFVISLSLIAGTSATLHAQAPVCRVDGNGNPVAGQWCSGDVILGTGALKYEPIDDQWNYGYVLHDGGTYAIVNARGVPLGDTFTDSGGGVSTACRVDTSTGDLWTAGDRNGQHDRGRRASVC